MIHKKALITHYIILGFIAVFLVAIALTNIYLAKERKLENAFYPNVYIDGNDVGEKTKDEILSLYQGKNQQLGKVNLSVLYKNEPIATLSAKQLNIKLNIQDIVDRAYLVGRTSQATSRVIQKITSIFRLRSYHFFTSTTYDKGAAKEVLSDIEDQYNKPAKNALFTFEEGRVVTFRPDEKGVKIESQKFLDDLDGAIKNINAKTTNIKLSLKNSIIQPEITLAESNNLGIEELIGEGDSDYSGSIPGRVHNVQLAASKFHGVLIPKDKVFSFNEIIGDISAQTGYEQAYIIQNGRTVLGDGGGVCQVSTTLFRAALNTGLPIVERTAHAYRVHYYENDNKPGLDATVFAPSVDLKFKNDTQAAILIQTEIDEDNNLLHIKFYGKKDDRRVELSPITVFDEIPPAPPRYEDDPTLPRGTVKQVDFAAWGAKSTFTYKVFKGGQTEPTINRTFLSVYRPWQAVYLNGTKD